jgi:hypothetical protein
VEVVRLAARRTVILEQSGLAQELGALLLVA